MNKQRRKRERRYARKQAMCHNPKCAHRRKKHRLNLTPDGIPVPTSRLVDAYGRIPAGRIGACKETGCECDHYWTESEAKWVSEQVLRKLKGEGEDRPPLRWADIKPSRYAPGNP